MKVVISFYISGKSCYAPSNYHPRTMRRGTLGTDTMSAHHNGHVDYNGQDIRLRSQSAMPGCHRTTTPGTTSYRPMTTNLPSRPTDLGSAHSAVSSRQRSSEDKENHANFAVSIEYFDGEFSGFYY